MSIKTENCTKCGRLSYYKGVLKNNILCEGCSVGAYEYKYDIHEATNYQPTVIYDATLTIDNNNEPIEEYDKHVISINSKNVNINNET